MNSDDQKFQAAFRKFGHIEFNYGCMDCCVFVAQVLKEVTGKDYMEQFNYSNQREAHKIIAQHGGFLPLVESVLGPSINSPGHCSPVVCWDETNKWFMGIHINNLVVCKTKFGLNQVAADTIQRSWTCPV